MCVCGCVRMCLYFPLYIYTCPIIGAQRIVCLCLGVRLFVNLGNGIECAFFSYTCIGVEVCPCVQSFARMLNAQMLGLPTWLAQVSEVMPKCLPVAWYVEE